MKILTLILPCILVLSLASCTTLANRRDLYEPSNGKGPYSKMLAGVNTPAPQLGAPNR